MRVLVVASTVNVARSPTTSPTRRPTPAPTAWPSWAPTDRAMDWHAGGVRMEANGLRLRVNGKVFRATGEALATGITYADRALYVSIGQGTPGRTIIGPTGSTSIVGELHRITLE